MTPLVGFRLYNLKKLVSYCEILSGDRPLKNGNYSLPVGVEIISSESRFPFVTLQER